MAERSRSVVSKNKKNPLLTAAADNTFPFEDFSRSTVFMPAVGPEASAPSLGVVQEDSFVTQTSQPSSSTVPLSSTTSQFAAGFPTFSEQHTTPPSNFSAHASYQTYGAAIQPPPANFLGISSSGTAQSNIQPPFQSFNQPASSNFSQYQPVVPSTPPLSSINLQSSSSHSSKSSSPAPAVQPNLANEHFQDAAFNKHGLPSVVPFVSSGIVTSVPSTKFESVNLGDKPDTQIQNPPQFFNVTDQYQTQAPVSFPISSSSNQEAPNLLPGYSPSPPVPPVGTSNTFRLGGQKKPVYAQPPGISTFNSPPLPSPLTAPVPTIEPVTLNFPTITTSQHIMTATPDSATIAPTISTSQTQYQPSSTPTSNEVHPTVLPESFHNLTFEQKYRPMYYHWFYKKEVETKAVWEPFSMSDSFALEDAFTSTEISPETVVPTDGGRYDVNVLRRQRSAIYWEETPTEVRRCSWFYKGSTDARYIPYEENISARLEEEFKIATTTNAWPKQVELPNGETVVFHDSEVMVHFVNSSSTDSWATPPQTASRPRVVKRGFSGFNIEDGEPAKIDHLVFLVHGIGSVCDLKFRKVEEVVDEFRSLSLQLIQSHFRTSSERGVLNRIEILPVSWHATLHGEATGIDRKLQTITLRSIPKLRHFTNDTLLDILFYTSPIYCQTIVDTVGSELNRLYDLFRSRNPDFSGGVSLGGHSLGSLILFDVLCHQKTPEGDDTGNDDEADLAKMDDSVAKSNGDDAETEVTSRSSSDVRKLSHRVSYVWGNAGTGQPFITYPQLTFSPSAFYALGSPIAMFVTVRGIDTLGEDFHLPTCPRFFNIFHPFDPVAYRIETLLNPELTSLRPVLIPHHKGRKRMHLELKETMARVGADLKQRVMDSVRNTWNSLYQLAMFHRSDSQMLENEVDKVIEEQLHNQDTESTHSAEGDEYEDSGRVGRLNGGRRVDYVLQEAPFESFNEYLFALGSHVCYWESEDTMLMILKEVYAPMGIYADNHASNRGYNPDKSSWHSIPYSKSESTLSSRPSSRGSAAHSEVLQSFSPPAPVVTFPAGFQNTALSFDPRQTESRSSVYPQHPTLLPDTQSTQVGMDPTAPISDNVTVGPPPTMGFYRK